METCRCEEYKKIVENYKSWAFGTIHPIRKRIPIPDDVKIVTKGNKISHDDLRTTYPAIIDIPPKTPPEPRKPEDIPKKWIPVLSGLISLRLCNEQKGLKDRPF